MSFYKYEISLCNRSEIREFIETHHYSHNINGLKSSYCFKVEDSGKLVGAVLFGELSTTSWKKYGTSEKDVVELRRLVLLDELPRNSESYVVGYCLRYLRKHSSYKVVVSYADPEYGHSGVIYKASNFKYLGQTAKDKVYVDIESGKSYHSRAMRTKYKGKLKPFAQKLRDKFLEGKLLEKQVQGKHIYVYYL